MSPLRRLAGTLAASSPREGGDHGSRIPRLPARARKSGRVDANGIDYYYEIHGEGEPLLVLHGGLGSSTSSDRARPCSPPAAR